MLPRNALTDTYRLPRGEAVPAGFLPSNTLTAVCALHLVKNTALGQIVHAVGAARLLQPVQARRLPRQVLEGKLLPVQVSSSWIASPSGSPRGRTPSEALFSLH